MRSALCRAHSFNALVVDYIFSLNIDITVSLHDDGRAKEGRAKEGKGNPVMYRLTHWIFYEYI